MTQTTTHTAVRPTRSMFGLPILGLVGLALLGVPRVVLHDLHLIGTSTPLTWLLAIGPVVLWDAAVQGDLPTVGDGPAAALIPRLAAMPSGLIVGTAMGAIGGLIARVIQAATQRSAR